MSSASSKEPAYYKKEITEEDITKLKNIFTKIQNDYHSAPFLEPVDYVELHLPDYPKIITHPMDLGTVEKNLLGGQFKTFKELMHDINLIWSNCRTYNLSESDIVKSANYCEKRIKYLIEKQFKNNKSKSKSSKNIIDNSCLTLEEKAKFIDIIKVQSNEVLTQIVKIILKECPKGLEDIDNEKLQVKIDMLDKRTYDLILQYIDKINNDNNSENNNQSKK